MRTLSIICLHFFDIFSPLCVKKKSVNQVHMYLQCIHIFIILARKHLQSYNLTISLIMVISYPFLFIYLYIMHQNYNWFNHKSSILHHWLMAQLVEHQILELNILRGCGFESLWELCSKNGIFFYKLRTKIALSPEQRLACLQTNKYEGKLSIHRYFCFHSQIFDPITVPCFK